MGDCLPKCYDSPRVPSQWKKDQRVRILRGKNKGRTALVSYETDPHPLSSKRRFYLWLESRHNFWAPNHVLMNEDGFVAV